ncbi:MAG: Histidine kinase [Hydrocarboniphaga sp.]|uniref:sensor histidine kinase n=1 Tax=Hydrocarboniphaga sp. TaxID=2033016 RepID=UPI002610F19B|nr:sensor histidine kinase [Hydrocarboniphaga sp.]MDB5970257.1 Histidine kinase [Hydrocarboniphaga sp.]
MISLERVDPRRLPLRWQLSLAIVLVLSGTLAIAISVVLRNARNAVADELQASLNSTTSSLDATLSLLERLPPGEVDTALYDWIAAQTASRHLCVALRSGPIGFVNGTECPRMHSAELSAPAWFARGVVEAPHSERRQLLVDGRQYTVLLVADPSEELNESWDETRELLQLMVLMGFAVNALILMLVTIALRPLDAATGALARLHDGDFELQLPKTEARDLRRLVSGIERLAQRLARSAGENRRLLLQNLDLQEEERRLIARELHDEIGQHVTAIEMATIGLEGSANAARIHESVCEIHQLSRRMIRRLRPAALDTLGLAGGLQALLAQWQASQPQISVVDEIDPLCERIDAYTATHVYRIVQEALSNAVRHARADRLEVQLLIVNSEIRLRIADDGHGFDPQTQTAGLGLMGIRERIKALGGEMDIVTGRYAGCRLQIRLPLPATRRRSAVVNTLAIVAARRLG